MEKEHPDDYVTVVLPEFVVKHGWHHLLHKSRQSAVWYALSSGERVVRREPLVPIDYNGQWVGQ